jgi:hypothetical protein
MKKFTGALKKLGDASMERVYNNYSMIQIGDEVLTNVKIARKLEPFLEEGLRTKSPITIALMAGNVIMAVQIEGQQRYLSKYNWGGMGVGAAVLLIAAYAFFSLSKSIIPTIAVAGLFYWFFLRTVLDYLKIAGEGGKKI